MRTTRLAAITTFFFLLAANQAARADTQGFALDRFDPAVPGSAFFAQDSIDFHGEYRPAFGVVADYANKPLVLYNQAGAAQAAIVGDQYFQHFGASMVLFKRLRLGLNLPVAFQQSGTSSTFNGSTFDAPSGAAVGDLRIDADVRIVGANDSPFKLALGAAFYAPTGSPSQYTGDGGARFSPRALIAGEVGWFVYAASLGLMIHADDGTFAGNPMGDELLFGGSVAARVFDKHLTVGPEIYGRTDVTSSGAAFARHETPVEALLGAHVSVGHFRFGAAGGAGVVNGYGSPDYRLIASLDYIPSEKASDRDHDEIFDTADACPDVPGVATEDPKTNGCPSDRDQDTIVDNVDACPDTAGVANDDPTKNGCPVPTDRDKDGIVDNLDACPDQAGPANADATKNGCPKATLQDGQIKIAEQVNFETGSAKILPDSDEILGDVRQVLLDHPQLKKISVEGHTDNRGDAQNNQALSEERASAVVDWLTAHGVPASRLTSVGYGQSHPIDSNATEVGRQNNRRVEFHIVAAATVASAVQVR